MTLTAHQQAIRSKHLTASEAPILFGHGYGLTPADLALFKRDILPSPEVDSEAADLGVMMEPGIRKWAIDELGLIDMTSNVLAVESDGPLSCTYDCIQRSKHPRVALEVKTSGINNPMAKGEQWGDDGTDQVPDRVLIQVAVQMHVRPSIQTIYVPAVIGGVGRRMYAINRQQANSLIRYVVDRCTTWWDRHIVRGEPVEGSIPSHDTMMRLPRDEGKTVDIDPVLLLGWQRATQERKRWEGIEEAAKDRVINAMGDAGIGDCGAGGKVRWPLYHRKSLDTTRFKKEQPELAAQYTKESSYRVLRHKA